MKKQTNQQTKKSANKKPFSPTDFQVCKQTQPLDTLLIKGYRKRKKNIFWTKKVYMIFIQKTLTHICPTLKCCLLPFATVYVSCVYVSCVCVYVKLDGHELIQYICDLMTHKNPIYI